MIVVSPFAPPSGVGPQRHRHPLAEGEHTEEGHLDMATRTLSWQELLAQGEQPALPFRTYVQEDPGGFWDVYDDAGTRIGTYWTLLDAVQDQTLQQVVSL